MDAFARLLDLLAILQTKPSITGDELASRLGVTVRTLRRDIARLRDAGFEVEATPGVYGGYRLAAGSRIMPLMLTDDEAMAIAIALRGTATATVDGLDGVAAKDALAKLEQVLPARLRERVSDLRESTVSMLRTPAAPANAETLTVLARACRAQLRASFRYVNAAGAETVRTVEPYRLVQTSHCWYLVARDRDSEAWRTFRVDRLSGVSLTREGFALSDVPDVERLVTAGMAVAPYAHTAKLRVPVSAEEASRFVPRSYGLVDAIDDANSEVTIGFDDRRWLVHFVADLPWEIDVVDPEWLRAELADLGSRLMRAATGE